MSAIAPPPAASAADKSGGSAHRWETSGAHVWEGVQEDAEGRIILAEGETLAEAIRRRRKRLEQNDYAQRNRRVVRDMIRYVYILLDASRWMRGKDPVLGGSSIVDVVVDVLQDFVGEYYDQNPLSHLGFVLLKNAEAEIISPLSSSSKTHKLALQSVSDLCAEEGAAGGGEFSLQNGLEVAGRSLGHQPRHGSREIVIITSALSTCDPGSILAQTLPRLQHAKIRVSCLALSAELHICRKLADETAGTMGVCLDRSHLRDWLLGQCVPPPALSSAAGCDMIDMGFPTRTSSDVPSLVHASRAKTLLARTAFVCPQCQAKNSELPTDCAVCGLKLVLAPHLARSFHHLFPVSAFVERPVLASGEQHAADPRLLVDSKDDAGSCYACLRPLGASALDVSELDVPKAASSSSNELLRFQCPDCEQYFCVDCDAYLHDTLHNCPGCLSR